MDVKEKKMTTFNVLGTAFSTISAAKNALTAANDLRSKIAVRGSATEISALLVAGANGLEANSARLSSVAITNGDRITLTAQNVSANKDVLLKLSTAALNVSDVGASFTNTALNDLTNVQSKINAITVSDGNSSLTLTGAQVTSNKAVLLKLTDAALNVSDKGSNADGAGKGIQSNYLSLDAVYSKIHSITETTDNATISYSTYKQAKNGAGIDAKIGATSGQYVAITDFSGSSSALSSLVADTSVTSVTIKDTVANLNANAALIISGGSGKIGSGSVTVNDTFANIKTSSAQTLISSIRSASGTPLLGISLSMNASEANAGNMALMNDTSKIPAANRSLTTVTINDSAQNISKNAGAINAFTTGLNAGYVAFDANTIKVSGATVTNNSTLKMSVTDYTALKTLISNSKYQLTDVAYADISTAADAAVLSFNVKDSAANLKGHYASVAANIKLSDIQVTAAKYSDATSGIDTFNSEYASLSSDKQKKIRSVSVTDTAANLTAVGVMTTLASNGKVGSINATEALITDIATLESSDGATKVSTISVKDSGNHIRDYENAITSGTKPLDRKVSIGSAGNGILGAST